MIQDLSYRQAMQSSHPIVIKHGYVAATTTITLIKGLLCDWIELGKGGLAFVGDSRAGKSYAIRELSKWLQEAFPRFFFLRLNMETEAQYDPYERTFSEWLGQILPSMPRSSHRQSGDRLTNYLLSQCRDRRAHLCVMLLDEAQRLYEHQWEALGVVWNRLEDAGIGVCVFSFGNEKLRTRANLIRDGGTQGIGGRFFIRVLDFDGVRTQAELTELLAQYDEPLWHPTPDWPFTRFFAMEAFDRNQWRLKSEGEAFWKALGDFYGLPNKALHRGYPMQWITDPIHFVLKDCLNQAGCQPGAKPLPWTLAIETLCPPQFS